jgi:hypothetical protein
VVTAAHIPLIYKHSNVHVLRTICVSLEILSSCFVANVFELYGLFRKGRAQRKDRDGWNRPEISDTSRISSGEDVETQLAKQTSWLADVDEGEGAQGKKKEMVEVSALPVPYRLA